MGEMRGRGSLGQLRHIGRAHAILLGGRLVDTLHLRDQGAKSELQPAQCHQPEDTARSSMPQVTRRLHKIYHLTIPTLWDADGQKGKALPQQWKIGKNQLDISLSQESSGYLIDVMKGTLKQA